MEKLHVASGIFQLERLPKIKNDTLRAWDAADELLIDAVYSNYRHLNATPLLLANDSFGALAVALNEFKIHSWSDSFISHLATTHNLTLNTLEQTPMLIPSNDDLQDFYDVVLIKIPKTLSLLEDQLCRLKPHMHQKTVIMGAAMSKHIHSSTLKLFEKIIGTTTTSLATKKARLIYVQNDQTNTVDSPYPRTIKDESTGIVLQNLANVFSNDHLDIGTRFFLKTIKNQLKQNPEFSSEVSTIIDLGCGNGILGIAAKQLVPHAKICFTDESYAAISSAKINYQQAISNRRKSGTKEKENNDDAVFIISNSLDQYQGSKPDLILCNPPFHQAHTVSDHIAWSMFKQSKQILNTHGELWVVGNRHLGYHIKLKKLFGNCITIANDKKFVVLLAKK